MDEFEAKLKKQNAVVRRRMEDSGLFQKMTKFYVFLPEIRCEAVLSTGEYIDIRFEGCYTSMRVYWIYDDSFYLSTFYRGNGRDLYAHWQEPDLSGHLEQILEWCSDVVDGKYSWRDKYDNPGPATMFAVPLATAIKEAMLDGGSTFAHAEEFKQHVLTKVRNGSDWKLNNGKLSCGMQGEFPATVALEIVSPAELDLMRDKFEKHTIVYAPESPGRYFLYAIDEMNGERSVRTLVDGWLNDPSGSGMFWNYCY